MNVACGMVYNEPMAASNERPRVRGEGVARERGASLAPGSDDDNLLGLVMIVKNEVHGISDTLTSFRPFITRWTILDTGSTDGTQSAIRSVLDGVPGSLHEEPFVDFSTSRNRALDLHGQATDFVFVADSDDVLLHGDALSTFLSAHRGASGVDHEAYLVQLVRGDLSYFLPLVMRTKAGWRYVGRVHEYATRPGAAIPQHRIPETILTQTPKEESIEASKKRWVRDAELLKEDLKSDPTNPRTVFYLAQTYECLGQPEEALPQYERRIELGGWMEEVFESKRRRARMMKLLERPWPEILDALLDAYLYDPSRAEPLYEIARHYHETDSHALTYLFASRAADLDYPKATLFVDRHVYEGNAAELASIAGFYVRDKDPSINANAKRYADHAISWQPDDNRLRMNRAFYAESADKTFGATIHRVAFQPESPFVPTNPSIHSDPRTGRLRMIIRCPNYRISNGRYITPRDEIIRTRNFMVELSEELSVTSHHEMIDRDPTPRTNFPVHGYEDCRLFQHGDALYATATVCDFAEPPHVGQREIVLLRLDPKSYDVLSATPLRGRWSERHQKNWMPAASAGAESEVPIVYSLHASDPTTVFYLDPSHATIRASDDAVLDAESHARGGSQLVSLEDGGYLCIIHDVTFSGHNRTYLHRFVKLDASFALVGMTDGFYFVKRGIEFAAGLARRGDDLIASFGVDDSSAYLAVFPLDRVLSDIQGHFEV